MLPSALDTVLDRTVVLGYTRIGYEVRRRSWEPLPAKALAGRTALVTGANSGLGKASVAGLAGLGARVQLLVRNQQRGEAALREIAGRVPGAELDLVICDMSDLAAVAATAARLLEPATGGPDLVVHSAGVFPTERTTTPQGHETAFATHVLGPHLLTHLLPDVSRIIWVTSGGMYSQKLPHDLEYERGEYKGSNAYARTKRMQVVLAEEWARVLPAPRTVVHSMHPGWAATPGIQKSLPTFSKIVRPLIRTPEEGADTIVWLCAADEPARSSGKLWHDRRQRPTHYLARTQESTADRRHLWDSCEDMTAPFRDGS
ncbi:MAG: SDR family NAD(P)-dependent oxidoreductase [Streptosporangiaceae bacterium]